MSRDPFVYHKPTLAQAAKMTAIRTAAGSLRDLIEQLAPASADRTVAIRALREVCYNANSAIILNEEA
jgi:hypothetical protein